ncbi:MAG TPA: EF-P lysine aminoacylase EpmA, partial [Myxococcota bacterium]|nr:EF-P lysine aminoacylase EpmA [Myxococcota bacterium]
MSDHVRFHANNHALFNNIRIRSRCLTLLREFFFARGFIEVETPIVCTSPGVETQLAAMPVSCMRRTMYLTTSPEFHMKRLVAVGHDRIFQVTRAFRDGERGDRHNPEFSMVEWYRRDCDYNVIMDDCQDLLRHIARGVTGRLEFPAIDGTRGSIDLSAPFRRVTMCQAFAELGLPEPFGLSLEERDRIAVDHLDAHLGAHEPEFLTEYPADQASLARKKPDDPRVAERFELYCGGLELCNGFSELSDADEYLERCRLDLAERARLGLPAYPIDDHYVSMLRDGLPPCSGTALGFDRLVMLAAAAPTIRDVIAFPWDQA